MKWVLALFVVSWFGLRLGAQEKPLVISIEASAAWNEAMNLLAQYHDVSYVYEEEVIPPKAYQEKVRLRVLGRRPVNLSLILDPSVDVDENLAALRDAIVAQETSWPVRAEGFVEEGMPTLVIGDMSQAERNDGIFGLARPRAIAGSYTPYIFSGVLATTQKASLQEMGVRLISSRISAQLIVRGEVGGEISGEWLHPHAGVIALIQHIEQQHSLRLAYHFQALFYCENRGYGYSADLLSSDWWIHYPNLRDGGTFISRERSDLDLASAEILAEDDIWIFVARQQPAVLLAYDSLRGDDLLAARAGAGGVYYHSDDLMNPNSEYVPISYIERKITAHCPPGASMAETLERAFNEPNTISRHLSRIPNYYGPVRFLPREGGGNYLYFGAGLFLDPERSHDDHSFAQDLPALNIPPGVTLAAAVEQLYQALPETPEQGLMLAEGAWQEVILTEELSLGNRTFGSAVCDLFSAMGLPPGILRVHYGISEKSYIFTYHEPESD
ncbi:MAG: hypothetical protein EA401_13110 [Planctomycetota bacterium]|nr:MAG: hypothetical protein EA401_13110 [Planctomycetota bacterium]